MDPERADAGRATMARLQGVYWLAIGLWPVLHYRSFETVTGPKRDDWLVRTLGGLVAVVGATLLAAGVRRRVTDEVAALGGLGALALGTADIVFAACGRISRVYFADAAAEAAAVAAWALASRPGARTARAAPAPEPTVKLGELPA